MSYVIKGPRGYVTPRNSKHSFTRSIEAARIFNSVEAAKSECCGDEVVYSILFSRPVTVYEPGNPK